MFNTVNFCVKFRELVKNFSHFISSFSASDVYDSLGVRYGNDTPEAQLEALLQIALRSSEIGFRPKARRVVVLFTDASYHVAGDGAAAGITTPNNLDSVLDGLPPGTGEDYPRIEDLRKTLITNNLEIVFAVTDDQTDNYKPYVATYDSIGCLTESGEFQVAGTSNELLVTNTDKATISYWYRCTMVYFLLLLCVTFGHSS